MPKVNIIILTGVSFSKSIFLSQDRANQARIIDLETNITRLKADIAAVKRSKEDVSIVTNRVAFQLCHSFKAFFFFHFLRTLEYF